MKRMLASSGYTIIEVMIVLAISGGMLVSVATMISGQQSRTQFVTAVRETESKMQDIFNDAESGVFPNKGTTSCTSDPTVNTAAPVIAATPAEQGTNSGCIFLGKAVQFYNDSTGLTSKYNIMPIVGKRQYTDLSGKIADVFNIDNAVPTPFYKDAAGAANTYETGEMVSGLQLDRIIYYGTTYTNMKGIAVLAAVGAGATKEGGAVTSGDGTTNNDGGARLAVLNITSTSNSSTELKNSITALNSTSMENARKGIIMCLNEGPGGRRAAITVGLKFDAAGTTVQSSGQTTSTDTYFEKPQLTALGCPTT